MFSAASRRCSSAMLYNSRRRYSHVSSVCRCAAFGRRRMEHVRYMATSTSASLWPSMESGTWGTAWAVSRSSFSTKNGRIGGIEEAIHPTFPCPLSCMITITLSMPIASGQTKGAEPSRPHRAACLSRLPFALCALEFHTREIARAFVRVPRKLVSSWGGGGLQF